MWTDLLDIALVAVLMYAGIVWMRRARAHRALFGLGILGCIYGLSRVLGLGLTAWLFQGFLAALLILVVVLFQAELRQALERMAMWGRRRDRPVTVDSGAVAQIVNACALLASQRRGALIVLPGRDDLTRHLKGGLRLDGELSEPLLLSLFDPHSPGHDGAVVIDDGRVRRFATHIPLSTDRGQLGLRGTRHAAALGLAECSDALCLLVSEETGRTSIARDGTLREVAGAAAVTSALQRFLEDRFGAEREPDTGLLAWLGPELSRRLHAGFRPPDRPAVLAAIAASGVLWLAVIPGSEIAEATMDVTVIVTKMPPGYTLEGVEPPEVAVLVSGLRRDLFFAEASELRVEVSAELLVLDRITYEISEGSVVHPPGLTVKAVNPPRVRVRARKPGAAPAAAPGARPAAVDAAPSERGLAQQGSAGGEPAPGTR
jgi:uncharacterized protein (TIGR00159 family)